MAQAPCVMSTLKVLQTCPTQRKNRLLVLGAMDPENSRDLPFKQEDFKSMLSHQLAFQIPTKVNAKKTHHTVLDEGASTSLMSLSCW